MGQSKSNSKRGIYHNTILPQEISLKQRSLTLKATEGRTKQTKPEVSIRKKIIKLQLILLELKYIKTYKYFSADFTVMFLGMRRMHTL